MLAKIQFNTQMGRDQVRFLCSLYRSTAYREQFFNSGSTLIWTLPAFPLSILPQRQLPMQRVLSYFPKTLAELRESAIPHYPSFLLINEDL